MSKRPYLDASTMRPVYDRYLQSGQTIKAFCAVEQINQHTFNYWRHKFIKEESPKPGGFQQIHKRSSLASTTGVIVIRLGTNIEVELPAQYNPQGLSELLRSLTC